MSRLLLIYYVSFDKVPNQIFIIYYNYIIDTIMHPLSKDDNDTRKQQSPADNSQAEQIEDGINKLPANKSKVIASKISKFASGFKIPDNKKPKISKSKVHERD
jgi:hypothetical protein